MDDFDTTVDRLYAGKPAAFVAARDAAAAQARATGDTELAARLKALRRPSVAAALSNLLVRSAATPGIDQLLELGARSRDAQRRLDAPAMKSAAAERNRLVTALLDSVQGLAEEPVSNAVRQQLTATFTAAIADPAAEAAVASGRLVSAISYSGFGEVDVSDAIATPLPARPTQPQPRGAGSATPDAATPDETARDTAAETAARSLQRAQEKLRDAETAERTASAALEVAQRTLAAARHTHGNAADRARASTAARQHAEQAVADAQAAVDATS